MGHLERTIDPPSPCSHTRLDLQGISFKLSCFLVFAFPPSSRPFSYRPHCYQHALKLIGAKAPSGGASEAWTFSVAGEPPSFWKSVAESVASVQSAVDVKEAKRTAKTQGNVNGSPISFWTPWDASTEATL